MKDTDRRNRRFESPPGEADLHALELQGRLVRWGLHDCARIMWTSAGASAARTGVTAVRETSPFEPRIETCLQISNRTTTIRRVVKVIRRPGVARLSQQWRKNKD
jgi:hypothetical protein